MWGKSIQKVQMPMCVTAAADRLELALEEIREAIRHIESASSGAQSAPDDLNDLMLDALRRADRILKHAQEVAVQRGIPTLRLNGG